MLLSIDIKEGLSKLNFPTKDSLKGLTSSCTFDLEY
jgi:hypothetical protein